MYSESADNVDHVKEQIMAYWLEKNIAFDPDLFQVNSRKSKMYQPGTKKCVTINALHLKCDPSIRTTFRAACRTITGLERNSEYPLIWNYVFAQQSKFMELGNENFYRCAVRHAEWEKNRFTFPIEHVHPAVNPHCDAPFIDWGTKDEPKVEATQSIATLMITQATATMEQGKQVFLFDKVQVPEGKTGTWFVQGDKRTCDQSRHWLDTQMVAKLAAWFGHDENKAEGRLTAADIGPLVRKNSTRDKSVSGTVASVEDRVAEKYIATMKSAVAVKPSAPPAPRNQQQSAGHKGKRHRVRGTTTWADVASVAPPVTNATDPTPADTMTYVTHATTASPITVVSPMQTDDQTSNYQNMAQTIAQLTEDNKQMREEMRNAQATMQSNLEKSLAAMVTARIEESQKRFEKTVMDAVTTSAQVAMEYADMVVASQYSSINANLNRLLNSGSNGELNVNSSPPAIILTAAESVSKLRAALNAKSSGKAPQQQQVRHNDSEDAEMTVADQSGRKRSLSGGKEDSDSKYAAVEEEVESPSVPVAPPGGGDERTQ